MERIGCEALKGGFQTLIGTVGTPGSTSPPPLKPSFQTLIGTVGTPASLRGLWLTPSVSNPYRYGRNEHVVLVLREGERLFQTLIGTVGTTGRWTWALMPEVVSNPYRYGRNIGGGVVVASHSFKPL